MKIIMFAGGKYKYSCLRNPFSNTSAGNFCSIEWHLSQMAFMATVDLTKRIYLRGTQGGAGQELT